MFDWGDLFQHIREQEQLISTLSANREDAQGRMDAARTQLSSHQESVRRLSGLLDQLKELKPTLESSQKTLDRDRQHMLEIMNIAFDVSIFLGGLAASMSSWDAIQSASGFVTAITRLQVLMDVNAHLTGLFITDTALFDDSLRFIAGTDDALLVGLV
ncbi:hypothetical protein EW146_g2224 [Bondarzewia mesenterica]|uniref:Uncharacterized protein n=1 Tax=Bondarzewia mesenterica TaxID=1095465 RepID=A0A4S4M3K0_9AGAM|nr:hypothetical protein EW146_g2224 [Bondarzewia mesenterica]